MPRTFHGIDVFCKISHNISMHVEPKLRFDFRLSLITLSNNKKNVRSGDFINFGPLKLNVTIIFVALLPFMCIYSIQI